MRKQMKELQIVNPPQFEKNLSLLTSHFSLKRRAFTLAEVLITLGIIGVVAAITMPTLMNNFKKKTYETQFLKTVNYIVNANKKILQEEEVDTLCQTDYFTCNNSIEINTPIINSEKLEEYTSRIKLEKQNIEGSLSNLEFDEAYVSNFGACFYSFNNDTFPGLNIAVDTNCQKAPNIGGRDLFYLLIDKYGNILTYNNQEGSVWDTDSINETCEEMIKENVGAYAGLVCAQRLILNGYKMDY